MDLTGLYVFAVGIFLGIGIWGGSFLMAVANMGSVTVTERSPGSIAAGHLGAMGGMVVGSLVGSVIAFIGVLMLIVEAVAVYG